MTEGLNGMQSVSPFKNLNLPGCGLLKITTIQKLFSDLCEVSCGRQTLSVWIGDCTHTQTTTTTDTDYLPLLPDIAVYVK